VQLTITNLRKTYANGVRALDDLNLDIKSGMFGLLGPNGAGKSSLMRTLATLQLPDAGEIDFDGIDVRRQPLEMRKVLGYLPQEFGVYPRVSAEELLDYFAVLKGIANRAARRQRIAEVLTLVNLYDDRRKHVHSYSGGMKQRFGIAQLLLGAPRLIIVDEPTAGLDPAERRRFLNVLREIASSNIILFSTHLVDDIQDLCNDMAIMNGGRILKQAAPAQAVAAMAGKIWAADVSREQANALLADVRPLSTRFNADQGIHFRLWAEQRPSAIFEPAAPTLEDVYFHTLQQAAPDAAQPITL
jgi:ABC-type multidrug transport system ATPase subunit